MNHVVDPHIFAVLCAGQTCLDLTNLLPRTDILDEISGILIAQQELIECLIYGKHFGTDNLNNLIESFKFVSRSTHEIQNE